MRGGPGDRLDLGMINDTLTAAMRTSQRNWRAKIKDPKKPEKTIYRSSRDNAGKKLLCNPT